ncbi:MAG: T9SS type A sorting domain-containing protein, partial [Chlorobi bacterium]|nr:T9SS type A sorting domain-containing protein [Chlorobiota bacterium]
NFEISSDDASYSGSITLSAYDGTTTTFYARMISGLSAGSYSGNITVSGGGASDITLNLSGDVLIPELISSKDTVFDLNYPVDRGPSNSQDFNLSGNGLDGTDVTLSAPADFEISTDNTAFSASVTLANFDGNSVTLYVRLKSGLAIGNYSGDIIISGGGASDIKVNLNGEVLDGCSLDLIISEYVEGSGNNKFIELYNGTGKDIDLDNYELIQYNSGGSEYSLSLSGTVSDGNVFVIENENEDLGVSADFSTSDAVMTFNGDDPVALRKNGSDIDIVGSNPGDNFGEDITLVRKPDVLDGAASYDASQWDSYGIDDVSHLGSHTMICTCEEPVVDASNLTFSNITVSSMDLSWTNGDGVSRIVIACEDSPVSFVPADNNTYTANSSFGSGTDLGSGNYCVYNGTGNSVTVTGLTPGTTYYFKIYEYGCQAGSEDYLTNGTPEEGNETTVPNDVSDFSVVCTTATTANLSWTLPEGNYDGIMIAVLEGATPDNPTCDGVTLTSADTDFSSASVYCSNASGAVYVYNDLGTSVTVTGLTSGNTYNFKAFVYKNGSWSAGNEIIQTAEVSDVSDLTSSCGNEESMIAWTNPSSACFDEVIIAVNTSSVSALPSGTYTANSLDYTDSSNPTLSDGSVVVYNGTSSPQTVTGLTNGTTYYFKVFVRSGSDWSAGKEVSCAATTASFFDYGDLAIVGINTHYIDSDASASDDEIQFVCFKDITTETSIDFTDNGYERLYAGKWGDSEGTITLTRTGPDVPAGTVITVRGKNQASNWHVFIGSGTPNGSLTDDDANWTITDGGTGNNVFDLNVNDQIWMMQGGTWDNPAGDHNATYSGKVLYGWTAIGWEDAPGYDDTKGSTIFPSSACSVTNLVGVDNEDKVRYNDDVTETTQREWISRFNDEQKWEGYTDSTAYQEGGTLPDVITVTGSGFSGTYQWTGDTSEDWDDCTNWLNLKVPDASADVIFVSDDCNNDLVIESGQTVACHNFTVSGTNPDHFVKLEGHSDAVMEIYGNLTIGGPAGVFDMDDGSSADDGTLKIYGDFIENTAGGFSDGNSLVEFCGSSEQSVSTAGSTLNFYNLTLNNTSAGGLVSGSSLQINGTLNLESGIFNLNGYDLTLSGDFSGINGVFAGNQSSNITVNGSGTLDYNFSFAVPQELNSFTLDRDSESAVFATDLTLGSLQIDAGTVELETGKYYTVTGNIVNTPGTSGLILKSDATGTASLIQNNENIEATCERYIPGNVWSYLFSPLDDVSSSLFTSGNPNVFYYDESTDDYWDATTIYGTTGWVPVTGTLSIDKGFINYYNTSKVYELTGGNLYYDATNKNKVFTLTYNDSGSGSVNENGVTADWDNFEGWNLIGNPYTSAVDWDQVTLSDVENIIYYYDGAAANYKYYGTGGDAYDQGITVNGGSQFIPANQGVFVKAINDGGTVTIPDAARVHNAQAFWKKQTKVPADILRLQIEQNGFVDETVVRIIDEATEDHDAKYDAYKFFSLDNTKPMLYSRNFENTRNFAVNSIPEFGSEKVIPLGMYIGTDDEYKIKMTENRFDKMHIYLQDKDLSEYVNLVTNPEYTFYQNATDFSDRFSLNFKKNTPPVLNANIPDQFITKGETYNYVIPSDIFADSDQGDILYTSATSEDGSALPAWISYDAETMTFTGVPDSEQVLNIKITAEDIFGETVSDTYKLTVTSNSEINTFEEMRFNIYPNPTDGKFVAEFNYPADATVSVTDISGKEILRKNMHSNIEYFDLSKYSKGIYIIKIKTDNLIINKRIILK